MERNLKTDLQQNIENERYYTEHELVRVANDMTIPYSDRIIALGDLLEKLAINSAKKELVEVYFKEKKDEEQPPMPQDENPEPVKAPEPPMPSMEPDNVVQR